VRTLGCAATRRSPALTDLRVNGSWVKPFVRHVLRRPQDAALVGCLVTSHGLSLLLEPSGGVSAGLLHFPAGNAVLPRKLTVLRQVVLCSQSRRMAQIVVEAVGERQTFSVHEVAHNHVEWVGGQVHYKLGYAAAIRLMAEKVVGRA
jgi:hypothetical protein